MHDEPFWVNAYQLRFFDEVVRDVLELCPDAWYLQVANPVLAGMTWLGRRYPQAKMVGLVPRLRRRLPIWRTRWGSTASGSPSRFPGVNHTVFLTHAYHDGHDIFPLLMPGSRTRRPRIGRHARRATTWVR